MLSNGERDGLMLVGGLGLGAALMFFFDPSAGRRRRARARGSVSRVIERRSSDEAIGARVRSVLARSVSHPRSISVEVANGRVVLGGPVIAREVDRLLRRVRKLRGVRGVRSRLEAHDWAADVPGLQGVVERRRRRGLGLIERGWPTGVKLVGGAALGALALRGARSLS